VAGTIITPVNLLDLVIVAVLVFAVVTGYHRGAALQLSAYAGLLLGLVAGAMLAPTVAGLVGSPLAQAFLAIATMLTVAGIGDALGWVLGMKVWSIARRSGLGAVDAVAGSAVAGIAVVLAIWFLGFHLANGPFQELSSQIRGSTIIRSLDRALPRPPPVLAEARQFLNQFGFPEVFADLPPAPAGPVRGPSQGEAGEIAGPALDSTVQVVGEACDAIQEGSGFVGAANYVVTNAHVVAGVDAPQVQEQGGGSQPATTVLYDPDLDIAILHVARSPGPVLALAADDAERGADGAVIGYPGGGDLTFGPAAVRRQLNAIGRDIYGESVVEREVYELQADVQPGNSGGPFVLESGGVGGVVFAASTTDSAIGYAITAAEVAPKLDQAEGRTDRVSTQSCLR
jgi:S1-C subfamily serine protease